ncbi:MAG: type IX secretion system plug protein domain-containing protein [Ignavibacteriales bacterium]
MFRKYWTYCICSVFIALFLLISDSFAELKGIKSLKAYTNRDETSLPVIVYDDKGNDVLTIEFDLQADYEPSLSIVFRFCDKDWNPYNNLFLANIGQNVARNLSFEPLPVTVQDAKYHFKGGFPDKDGHVDFPFSGKWRFYITDSQDTSKVYATGKFVVVKAVMPIKVNIKNELLENKSYFPQDLARVFNITTDFTLPDNLFPFNVEHVEIIENQKVDYAYRVERAATNNDVRFYWWDGNKKFSFTSKEIRPGNEYRQTDLRNINIYSSRAVNAHFDGVETSRFYIEGKKDLDGGSILSRPKDPNAVYLDVTFRLRSPEDIRKKVFLVGAFNQWQILPEYEMANDNGLYTTTVNLKRGIYDYQYAIANMDENRPSDIDWFSLEGNTWSTRNRYYIFVYYADPDKGGYDRIIGFTEVINK